MFSRKGSQSLTLSLSNLYISFRSIPPPPPILTNRYQSTTPAMTTLRRAIGRGQIQQARQAYDSLTRHPTSKLDRQVLRKLLLLARQGKRPQDIDFIHTVLHDMTRHFHIPPQHFEYHALIYAYGLHHLPEKAYRVLDHMRQHGTQPNLYTYNTLLGCYKRTNDLHQADHILQEMKQNKIKPDTVTYNTLLQLLLKTNEFQRLFDLYQRMKLDPELPKPDIYTYSTVLDAAIKSQNEPIGTEISDSVLTLNNYEKIDIHMLNNILRFKSNMNLNQVLDLYYQLPTKFSHIQPDKITFNILLDACLKSGNPAKAYMLFRDMKKSRLKPDIITYGTLIDAESRLGNLKEAIQLFQDMCDASIEPNDRIMTSLVNIASSKSASSNDLDTLVSIIDEYKTNLDTRAYNSLMYGLALNGKSKQVQHLYDTVFRYSTCQPDISTFTNLILSYINDDYLDDAMEIYYTLREHHKKCRDDETLSNIKTPIQLDSTFYSTLIASLSTNISPTTTTTYDEYESSPRLITAMSMFNDMRPLRIQPTMHTYTAILHACGQYRDRYVLHQIHQQIKVDMYLDPDIGMYNALMDAYNRTEDGDTVLDIWDTISIPSSYSTITPDQTTVSIVLDSCGHNGFFSRAQTIWSWLKKTNFKLNSNNYNSYIECLCRSRGRSGWDQAYQLVREEMSNPKNRIRGKPNLDEKTINTLISFAKKKNFHVNEVNALEQWKSSLF